MAVTGDIGILHKKVRKLVEENIGDGETVEFCLVGEGKQSIVALNDRLLIIKPGFMAGATLGARATTFYYRDIISIEVNTGALMGVIEITTPSYQGAKEKDYWGRGDRDPYKISNCIPIAKRNLKEYQPYLTKLRTKIEQAKQLHPASTVSPSQGNLASELEKLGSLWKSGVLTDEEFEQAKKKLLG